MTPVLEAAGLAKRYGSVDALAGLDLVAESGQVVALPGFRAARIPRCSDPAERPA